MSNQQGGGGSSSGSSSGSLGRYHLAEPLGGGPTGEVFRAKVYGVAGFERQFAVKRFHAALIKDPAAAEMIATAARAYATVEHPRIARLHEYGVSNGQSFVAVELVAGVDGARLVAGTFGAGEPMPPGAALSVLAQIARAVGYAHGRGVLHLGICPTNILATTDGDVKVCDFGFLRSRLRTPAAADPTLAARMPYLAPEQLQARESTRATDVFALATLAYELLTGERAFHGRNQAEIAAKIAAATPASPSSGIALPVLEVLKRAFNVAPTDRFPDANSFADALDAAIRKSSPPGGRTDIAAAVKKALGRAADMAAQSMSGAVTFPLPAPPASLGGAMASPMPAGRLPSRSERENMMTLVGAAPAPSPYGTSDITLPRQLLTPPPPPPVSSEPPLFEAGELALRAFAQAGFSEPDVVEAQFAPDPEFPTVNFPNPEEPGTLDLALAQARRSAADLVIANDPDGDRLAVAVPDPEVPGGWRPLSGDQVGALLGAFLLRRLAADPDKDMAAQLVASTIVSGSLLARVAEDAGAQYVRTLTGFKWIARAADLRAGARFAFGYEEALGYEVTAAVRDKDGISAALALLSLAAVARSVGESLVDAYDGLERKHGVHLTAQLSVQSATTTEIMSRLRTAAPEHLAGERVTAVTDYTGGSWDLPSADVLAFELAGARVVIRPSGTEPKIKAYLEVVEPVSFGPLGDARQTAAERMERLRAATAELLAS